MIHIIVIRMINIILLRMMNNYALQSETNFSNKTDNNNVQSNVIDQLRPSINDNNAIHMMIRLYLVT